MSLLFSVFRAVRFAYRLVRWTSMGIAITHAARRYAL